MDVDPEVVAQRRADDKPRNRPSHSVKHLRKWLEYEKSQLRKLCQKRSILFLSLSTRLMDESVILKLIRNLAWHDEMYNYAKAKVRRDNGLHGWPH